jgi:pilus assembly protein FimV
MTEVFVQNTTSNLEIADRQRLNRLPRVVRRWNLHAVAGAVALLTALSATDASALALGRVTVQSMLGEPLRAEIDVPSITDDEASTLQIGVAPPDRFRAASMDYNALLGDVSFEVVRSPDGRTAVRLRSNRAVSEPFLDLVVQATWANGQLLRGYTMLFDPPNLRPAAAPLLPATSAPAPVVTQVQPATPVAPPPAVAAPRPAIATAASPPVPPIETQRQVTVRAGDTAGRIAETHRPAGVSLDQMLIGLLRANPQAFMGSNVNRLKAGVVLDIPQTPALASVDPVEARQLVAAQSRDFNEYRRRLANLAPSQTTEAPSRVATGTVQTEVTDGQKAVGAQDKLTLSKESATEKATQEADIAKARQEEEAKARAAELSRNVAELEKLREAVATAPTAPAEPVGQPPETPPAAASVSVVPPPPPVPAPIEPPSAPSSFVADLLANPLTLPAVGGLAALLGLLALLKMRQRKSAAQTVDSEADADISIAEGQSVDTSEEGPVSSMMYSPSQLDAGGDVDPVAEADVYIAYGRDKQAEEILLEALRLHPDKLPVRLKLLEIYAQRNDVAAFNNEAQQVNRLTQGQGPEWVQTRETGLLIDPNNPLYLQGGAPATPAAVSEPDTLASVPPDIDLNFDDDGHQAGETAASQTANTELNALLETQSDNGVELDFDLGETPAPAPAEDLGLTFDLDQSEVAEAAPPMAETAPPAADDLSMDFDLDLSEIEEAPAGAPPVAAAPTDLPQDVKDLSLDLDLDLDMDTGTSAETDPMADFNDLANLQVDEGESGNDPLETKLSLAREFEAIGDTDGARSLAEEVEAEASGDLQARARAFLAQLS